MLPRRQIELISAPELQIDTVAPEMPVGRVLVMGWSGGSTMMGKVFVKGGSGGLVTRPG